MATATSKSAAPKPARASIPAVDLEAILASLPSVKDDARVKQLRERHAALLRDLEAAKAARVKLEADLGTRGGQFRTVEDEMASRLARGMPAIDPEHKARTDDRDNLNERVRVHELAIETVANELRALKAQVAMELSDQCRAACLPVVADAAVQLLSAGVSVYRLNVLRAELMRRELPESSASLAIGVPVAPFDARFIPGGMAAASTIRDFVRKAQSVGYLSPDQADEWCKAIGK